MSTQTVNLSHQKKKIVVLLSYDEVKNDPSSLQAMQDDFSSFKRFACNKEVSSDEVAVEANIISTRWCYALLRMRPLSISWAECSVVISCGKVDYDKSG
jgi:hypothetical protein